MLNLITTEEMLLNALWQSSNCIPDDLPCLTRQDYFLTLFFFKAICDHWQDDADDIARSYPDSHSVQQAQVRAELLQQVRYIVPAEAHFLAVQNGKQDICTRLERAFASLERANPLMLMGLFRDLPFEVSKQPVFPDQYAVIAAVLSTLSALDLRRSQLPYDGMPGQLFSMLLEKFAFTFQPAPDSCPTPNTVARLMASILAPKVGQSIYDPACRVGTLLVACAQWIRNRHISQDYFLFGEDVRFDRIRLARMQMLLLNMPHQLRHTESLHAPAFLSANEALSQFDLAICHPPENIPAWLAQMLANSPLQQFGTSLPEPEPDKAGFGFVLHMLACLKPESGRMAALLPYAALQRGGSDQAMRQKLLEANLIDAVIGLPAWLFPETDRRYAIILLQHGRVNHSVCMLDASHIAKGNLITVERIADFYHIGRDVPGYARLVKVGKLIADGGSLDVLGINT